MDAIDKLDAAKGTRTQIDLGREIGCGQGLLSLWLNREVCPSLRYAKQLRKYGITTDDLIALQAAQRARAKRARKGRAA